MDDIALYPIQAPGPSGSDRLSFEPEIRNDIFIQFRGTAEEHGHFLHDIELLDEAALEYMPHSASLSISSTYDNMVSQNPPSKKIAKLAAVNF